MGARWDGFISGLEGSVGSIQRTVHSGLGLAGDIFAIQAAAGGGGKKKRAKAARKAANLRALQEGAVPSVRDDVETEYYDDPARQTFTDFAATPQGKGALVLGGILVVVLGVALLARK